MTPFRVPRFLLALLLLLSWAVSTTAAAKSQRPNILFILADDLGYGDLQCFHPSNRIPTPHLDRLAAEGTRFIDAHTPSSVCTPTRYGLLTGRYAWRSRLQKGVLYGYSPPLLQPGQPTLATLLKSRGYSTTALGKWHLGLRWEIKPGAAGASFGDGEEPRGQGWNVDYSRPVRGGPIDAGFDHFFGISASLDMPPFLFIEQDRTTALPELDKSWIRTGPAGRDFEADNVLEQLTQRTVARIDALAADAHKGSPFFLYLALASPHTPILPSAAWKGRSGLNPYADFVMETDAAVGQIRAALKRNGLEEETVVIFTSDNGCSPAAGTPQMETKGHFASGPFRGYKADLYEGGHRVPLIVSWKGRTSAGTISKRLVSQTDWMATLADLTGTRLPTTSAQDSFSFADELGAKRQGPKRSSMVQHSIDGSFAYREGEWKLLLAPGSGGWSSPKPGTAQELGLPSHQLYHLKTDAGEKLNLFASQPGRARQLQSALAKIVESGHSRPTAVGSNDVPVNWSKSIPKP